MDVPTMDAYVPTDGGYFVSERMQIAAELIQEYDSWLELRWIPPDKRRTPGDKLEAYAVFDTHPNTDNKAVLYFSELDKPEDVVARIYSGDMNKGLGPLEFIDHQVAARKLIEHRKWQDSLAEASELAHFMVKSPLNYMKMHDYSGELVKFDDQRRRVAKS